MNLETDGNELNKLYLAEAASTYRVKSGTIKSGYASHLSSTSREVDVQTPNVVAPVARPDLRPEIASSTTRPI